MTRDEQRERCPLFISGLRPIEYLPDQFLDRSSLGIDVLRERIQEAGVDPGLSLDRRHASRIGQPVRNLLLRSAKGEHEVRGFVRNVPLAHEPLGFPDVDNVHQREPGVPVRTFPNASRLRRRPLISSVEN